MPASLAEHQQSTPSQLDVASEVRTLRLQTPNLPFLRLAKMVAIAPSVLCDWEKGKRGMNKARQRRVRAAVRGEFARHVVMANRLATAHGISVGSS